MRPNPVGKLREVTIQFKPPLAFALMTPASHKRAWAKYNRFRNYKERQGQQMQFFMDSAAGVEISALRARLREFAELYESGVVQFVYDFQIKGE